MSITCPCPHVWCHSSQRMNPWCVIWDRGLVRNLRVGAVFVALKYCSNYGCSTVTAVRITTDHQPCRWCCGSCSITAVLCVIHRGSRVSRGLRGPLRLSTLQKNSTSKENRWVGLHSPSANQNEASPYLLFQWGSAVLLKLWFPLCSLPCSSVLLLWFCLWFICGSTEVLLWFSCAFFLALPSFVRFSCGFPMFPSGSPASFLWS